MTFRTLLAESSSETKKYLLASKIEDMINTVVRQISFFEFENLFIMKERMENYHLIKFVNFG